MPGTDSGAGTAFLGSLERPVARATQHRPAARQRAKRTTRTRVSVTEREAGRNGQVGLRLGPWMASAWLPFSSDARDRRLPSEIPPAGSCLGDYRSGKVCRPATMRARCDTTIGGRGERHPVVGKVDHELAPRVRAGGRRSVGGHGTFSWDQRFAHSSVAQRRYGSRESSTDRTSARQRSAKWGG
jgi:hypothetical protein